MAPGPSWPFPAHDQRDWEFAREYGVPISQVIDPDGEGECDISDGRVRGLRPLVNSGQYSGLSSAEAFDALADACEASGRGTGATGQLPAARLGLSPASATGAPRSRSSTASLWHRAGAREDLPVILPEDVDFDGSGSPIKKMASFIETRCPDLWRRRRARDRHLRHLRRVVLVLRPLRLPRQRRGDARLTRQLLAAGRSVHRWHRARDLAPAVCALLPQGHAGRRSGRRPASPSNGC